MGRGHTKSRPEPLALSDELLEAHEDELLGVPEHSGDALPRAPEPPDDAEPAPAAAAPRRRPVGVVLVVVYVAIINVLAALTAYFAIDEREKTILRSRQRGASVARVLEVHLARTLGETERVMQAIAEQARRAGGFGAMTEDEAYRLMAPLQQSLPQSRGLMAIAPNGRVVAATAETPVRALNASAEPYFARDEGAPGRGHLGRVLKDPITRVWSIPLSQRVEGDGGLFEGVVVAFLDPVYFESLLRNLDLPPGTTVSILRRDGRLLARYPGDAALYDADLASDVGLHDSAGRPPADQYTTTRPDGLTRLMALRHIESPPLAISVAVPLDSALEPWEQNTLIAGLAAAVLALFVGIILLFSYQELRRRAEAEAALRTSNLLLEERIRERTAALEQSNRQLAAFSYSVSHDLRAPLRAINGFCQALEEDYGSVLHEQGIGYLKRVRRASERMGELIDSMVELTSLSRASVHRARTDLTAIARDIAAELADADRQRHVTFDISPDVVASADSKLVRILLGHLLDNAWKFTRDAEEARISFGTIDENGETVYFVDDNGIGFDMSHAGKLFTAFHRLHPGEDFEGFGIGLATVKHIVELHGGRVWADAVPGRGVVMYFTLSPRGEAT